MDKNFIERLRVAVGNKSVRSFARESDVSETVMRQYLSGKSDPTRQKLMKIAKAAGVDVCWLMSGKEVGVAINSEKEELSPAEEWLAEIRKSGRDIAGITLELYRESPEFKEWYDKKRGDNSVQETPIQRKQVA